MAWIEPRGDQHRVYWYPERGSKRKTYEPFADASQAGRFLELIAALGGDANAARDYINRDTESPGTGPVEVSPEPSATDLRTQDDADPQVCTMKTLRNVFGASKTGVTSRTRSDYLRDIDRYVLGYFGDDFDVSMLRAKPRLVAKVPNSRDARDSVAGWVTWMKVQPARSRSGKSAGHTLSAKTIRNVHGVFFEMMQVAVDDEDVALSRNPCDRTALPTADAVEMQFLEHAEFATFLSLFATHFRPLLLMLVMTGMRWGEAAGLQMKNLHLDAEVPNVYVCKALKRDEAGKLVLGRPKTRSSIRTISLNAKLVQMLREHTRDLERNEFVFTMPGGGRLHHGNFHHRFWKPAVAAAVQAGAIGASLRIHDLRHTNAAWLISAGRPLRAVKDRLGHQSILTTDRYSHLITEVDAGDRTALDAAFPELAIVPAPVDDALILLIADQNTMDDEEAALPEVDVRDSDDLAA